jgi:hypothetical protein
MAQPFRWVGFKDGIGLVAWVTIEVLPSDNNHVYFETSLLEDSYQSPWKDAVLYGILYGLGHLPTSHRVSVKEITATRTDTNFTVAAYAALRAVWLECSYQPDIEEIERLERFVYSTWRENLKAMPNFKTLTLS